MARITIIPADGTVLVDGEFKFQPFDFSNCGVPSEVHALQWYDTRGWIEFRDDDDPFTPKVPNQEITELPAWATACVALHAAWTPPVIEIPPAEQTPVVTLPAA